MPYEDRHMSTSKYNLMLFVVCRFFLFFVFDSTSRSLEHKRLTYTRAATIFGMYITFSL